MHNTLTNRAADNIRILAAAMVEKAKSGHPGGAMGGADFVNILSTEFLRYDPTDPGWHMRDRFFLDPGHMSPMLYAVLALSGFYTLEELKNFRQWGSPTPGHPELEVSRGVENTSGPLGQGHVSAVGAAIAERFLCARFGEWMAHKTFAFISDGGVQEEISQGAGRIAGFLGLSNLIMFFDSNDIQLSTDTRAVTLEDTARKYRAWGWSVSTIDGHDPGQIRAALTQAIRQKKKPSLIIGKTIMGKGALTTDGASFERQCATHGMPLSDAGASFEKTVAHLGGNPADPFAIFPEVAGLYQKAKEQKIAAAAARKAKQRRWAKAHPELAAKLELFLSGQLPPLDFEEIAHKPDLATRAASGAVLGWLARKLENMIVASADLSNSDKTDGFLKQTKPFVRGDFSGAFLQAGVSELTMAGLCSGMALHGGVVPACGTFFVFSDYMKPVVRLSAPKQQDANDWGCSNQAPTVRLVRNTATGAHLRVLLTNLPADQVPAGAFGALYHQRWRIEEAFKRLKHRLHLEAVSGLSQHALLVDVAAKVLADNIAALMCLAAQDAAQLPANRRCQRTHADAAVRAVLPRVLLAVGDVLGLIDDTLQLIARTVHRITPGRCAPRDPGRSKPHPRLAYRAGAA